MWRRVGTMVALLATIEVGTARADPRAPRLTCSGETIDLVCARHATARVARAPAPADPDEDEPPPGPTKPGLTISAPKPIERGRVWGSLPLSVVGMAVGAVVGVGLGWQWGCTDEGQRCGKLPDNFEYMLGGVLGGAFAAGGAYLGGLRAHSQGSFGYDLLAGVIPGALYALAAWASHDEDACPSCAVGYTLVVPLSVTIVDYNVRRHRD